MVKINKTNQFVTVRKKNSLGLKNRPQPLRSDHVYKPCSNSHFKFKTTKSIKTSHEIIAQDRAIRAINMGLGIRKPGYNIYVAGFPGTGKTSVIKSFLEKWSADLPPPNDWVYVYDFEENEAPKCFEMPRGQGRKLKKQMDNLIRDLRIEIPAALQSEDYENTVNSYVSAANDRKAKLYSELEKLAKSVGFAIKSTRMGIETIPVVDGRALTEKDYSKLDDKQRAKIETRRTKLEPEVLDFARKVRCIDQETREYIDQLRAEVGQHIVGAIMDPLILLYEHHNEVNNYLNQVKTHILENLLDFVEIEEEAEEEVIPEERDKFKKYHVNVFVDNTHTKSAPIIIENNPTYYNLFGKIEKNVEHGMYLTDFTMIKPGAIHKANGGFLVIDALDVVTNPSVYEKLKRVLRNRKAFIEDIGEQYAILPTSGLRPEPVPLDLKVILIGNDDIYHILFEDDEEFNKIFKIKADFDYKMHRSSNNINSYVSFVATRSKIENLLPFDRTGVAAVVEFSSRLVEDQRLLSTQFGDIKDLTIEADFIARERNAKTVKREHVEEALDQKYYRLNLVEEHLLEMVTNEDILLTVDGNRIGQVNGLSVYDMGDYSFGKIGRITCTTSISEDGIVNIERASRLSGKIHDKGMYILSGFLNGVLAREYALGVSASVCFEQSYGMIDGDSASTAELIAIISAMAQVPVKQNFAITGSINQLGDVQPVGGINEKIEGFHKACKLIGKNNNYNIIIPKQNIPNLMLHKDVRKSIADGYLKIYPVKYVWEAFELVTETRFGIKDIHDTSFESNSALAIIASKLKRLHEEEEKHEHEHHHIKPQKLALEEAAKSKLIRKKK